MDFRGSLAGIYGMVRNNYQDNCNSNLFDFEFSISISFNNYNNYVDENESLSTSEEPKLYNPIRFVTK